MWKLNAFSALLPLYLLLVVRQERTANKHMKGHRNQRKTIFENTFVEMLVQSPARPC